MNISNIRGVAIVNGAISSVRLVELQGSFHVQLPNAYVQMLNLADGFSLKNGVILYSSSELIERNKTLEVEKYASAYLANR